MRKVILEVTEKRVILAVEGNEVILQGIIFDPESIHQAITNCHHITVAATAALSFLGSRFTVGTTHHF